MDRQQRRLRGGELPHHASSFVDALLAQVDAIAFADPGCRRRAARMRVGESNDEWLTGGDDDRVPPSKRWPTAETQTIRRLRGKRNGCQRP
jgi:hypothetical protein